MPRKIRRTPPPSRGRYARSRRSRATRGPAIPITPPTSLAWKTSTVAVTIMTAIMTVAAITTDTRPADARLALEEERALQRQREIDGGRKAAIGDIIAASEKLQGLAHRSGQGRH